MLLSWISPSTERATSKTLEAISASQGLCVNLRYLATREAHVTVAESYRMASTTVGHIFKES